MTVRKINIFVVNKKDDDYDNLCNYEYIMRGHRELNSYIFYIDKHVLNIRLNYNFKEFLHSFYEQVIIEKGIYITVFSMKIENLLIEEFMNRPELQTEEIKKEFKYLLLNQQLKEIIELLDYDIDELHPKEILWDLVVNMNLD